VLWADKQPEQGVLHVKLKLSSGGEQVGLFASDGTTPIDTLTYGAQQSDTSYGRTQDGGTAWALFSTPTIVASNSGGVLVGIKDRVSVLNNGFTLAQNYPNPFNPSTVIEYRLPHKSPVEIAVYNVLGEKVKTLLTRTRIAGEHRVTWDARDNKGMPVSGGLYFYRMIAGEFSTSGKI